MLKGGVEETVLIFDSADIDSKRSSCHYLRFYDGLNINI